MPIRFFDAHVRPPRGGWTVVFKGRTITGYSEEELVSTIRREQMNNGTFRGNDAIIEELWAYFCSREPERCRGFTASPAALEAAAVGGVVPAEITPKIQGPPIWLFLNTLAVQWQPGLHDYFLATVDAITVILECPDCRNEWRRLISLYPPAPLASRFQVCKWVNTVHNAVNDKLGRQLYPYASLVREFGAPVGSLEASGAPTP